DTKGHEDRRKGQAGLARPDVGALSFTYLLPSSYPSCPSWMLIMDKNQVAAILDEIGTLLEIQGENPFRCQAYHNAARALEQLGESLSEVVAGGRLGSIRGIGETLQEKITTLVTTGRLPFYDDLRRRTPPGLLDMIHIQGMGPKKVKALYDQLGIDDLDKLRKACQEDRVAALKGFGAKTQQKILEGIEFL